MLKKMQPGSVIVDVAIDQGGCFETSQADDARRPRLQGRRGHALLRREHARRRAGDLCPGPHQRDPPSSPGSPTSASIGAVTGESRRSRRGVNVVGGKVTYEAVAEAHGMAYTPLDDALAAGVA